MEVQDVGLKISSILLPAVIMTTIKVMNKNIWKCLWLSKVVNIGLLIPAILPQAITDLMKVVDIGLLRPATLPQVTAEVVDVVQVRPAIMLLVIAEGMLIYVDLGNNIPATLPLVIGEQELMLKGEVDIGLQPATITPLTKLNMVYS